MTQKKIFIILLAAVTIAVTTVASAIAFNLSASIAAKPALEAETSKLHADTDALAPQTDKLKKELSEVTAELSTKDTVNDYYMEYKKTHDALTMEVGELQSRLDALNSDIEKKQKELDGHVSESTTGRRYSLSANESYSCPEKIPAARYIAKGSGTLTITNSSGQTRVSQNLNVSYDNSYTFNLSAKEKIQATGNVILTELK